MLGRQLVTPMLIMNTHQARDYTANNTICLQKH